MSFPFAFVSTPSPNTPVLLSEGEIGAQIESGRVFAQEFAPPQLKSTLESILNAKSQISLLGVTMRNDNETMQLLSQVLTTTSITTLLFGSTGDELATIEPNIEELVGTALAKNKTIDTVIITTKTPGVAEQMRTVLSLLQRQHRIKSLHLTTPPGQYPEAASFVPLSVYLASNNTTAELVFKYCLNISSLIEIIKGMLNNTSVTSLKFDMCDIQGGLATLCDGLSANTTLQQLSIVSCGLDEDDCSHLGQFMQHNRTLKSLLIGGDHITETCLSNLVSGLKHNTSLTELQITRTNLLRDGAIKLAEIWANTNSIGTVNLIGTSGIKLEAVKVLADAWASSSALHSINVSYNDGVASEEYQHVLQTLVQNNQCITSVQCDSWNGDTTVYKVLQQLCRDNKQRKGNAIQVLIIAQTLHHSSMKTHVTEDVWPSLLYWTQTSYNSSDEPLLTREQVTHICSIAKQNIMELNKDLVLRRILRTK